MVDYTKWPAQNVKMWLHSEGLNEIAAICYEKGVTGSGLTDLSDEFLRSHSNVTHDERERFISARRSLLHMGSNSSHKCPPPEPNMYITAQQMIDSVDSGYSGWIVKQGGRFRSWKRRYMVLNKGILYYYENASAAQPKGCIILPGHVIQEATDIRDYPHCFKLVHKNPSKRAYFISTAARHELDKWNSYISNEIEKYKEENLLGQPIYGDSTIMSVDDSTRESNSDEDADDTYYIDPKTQLSPMTMQPIINRKNQTHYNGSSKSVKSPGSILSPGTMIRSTNGNCSITQKFFRNSIQTDKKQSFTDISPVAPLQIAVLKMGKSNSCNNLALDNKINSPLSELVEDPYLAIIPEPQKASLPKNLAKNFSHPEDPYLEIIPESPKQPVPIRPPNKSSISEDAYLEIIPDVSSRPPNKPLPTLPVICPLPVTMSPLFGTNEVTVPTRYEYTTLREEISNGGTNETNSNRSTSEPPSALTESHDHSADYVAPVVNPLPAGCMQPEFSRDRAEDILRSMNVCGMYLVRNGSEDNSQVLTVWSKDRCKHYKIFKQENGYCLHKGVYFLNLVELIISYRSQDLPKSDIKLTIPFNVQGNRQ